MDNLPSSFDATARQGATFGPITLTVSGIDLTLHTLTGGVGTGALAPTLAVVDSTHATVTFSAALTNSLQARAPTDRIGSAATKHVWWVDAVKISDPTIIIPLAAGTLSVVAKGGHD